MGCNKNLIILYTLLYEVSFDMLTINSNGIGMTIDPARQRKCQSVERRLECHPDPGPQYEWDPAEPGHEVGSRQCKAPIDTFDKHVIVLTPKIGQERRSYSGPARQLKTGEVCVTEISSPNTMDP